MDFKTVIELITTVGFPVFCCIAMGYFIFHIYKKTTEQNNNNMERVQARCKEREEKLYIEIKENREVNKKAIETIAKYAEKLETIQHDINDIKKDITIIMAKD